MMTGSGEYHRERPLRHYYETPSSGYSTCKGCCCCVFLLLSSLALLALAALLVIALAVKPKKPELNLQEAGIQYMAITPNPNDPTTLSLTVRFLFTVVNPNRVGIRCGESRFAVMYRGTLLGRASASRFCQQPHSVREVVATVAVDRVNLPPVDAADLTRDAWLNDRVELRVLGNVAVKIRLLNFDSPRLQVSVDCVTVLSPRNQSLTYKQCVFNGLKA